jgi:glutamate formiminotransferase
MPLIECVPNVSEGQRAAVIDACAAAITGAGVSLLDVSADPSHNRSVYTFAGEASALQAAVLALFDTAVDAIDLRQHLGEHPRIGAVDVVPFVPLGGATMDDCVRLSNQVADAVAHRHQVPIYLYEAASRRGHTRRLEDIRRGGLSGLGARMRTPGWAPDFGPLHPHPTAGVSVVGARRPLIAFNVDLATDRLAVAKEIARIVRQSSGGLPCVKAIGLTLGERGLVQVSMNLTDFERTSMIDAFDAVRYEAERRGVQVLGSELVGLAPAAALSASIAARVRLRDFSPDRILENKLRVSRHTT